MHHPKSVTRGVTIKNAIQAIVAALTLSGLAATAGAVTYVDVDKPDTAINALNGYHGVFDIVNPGAQAMNFGGIQRTPVGGYQLGTDLLSATASFYLYNRSQNLWETASVYIGILDGEWSQPIANGFPVLDFDASPFSLFLLESTGQINYAVHSSAFGNFRLEYAVLEVTTKGSTAPGPIAGVPDGGTTLVLLGLGLVGMVAVQTRLTRQAA